MLDAAARLAADGGFDGVQMRVVAAEAEVALGTLYRYFPSKEHLLVSTMLRQIGTLAEALSDRPPRGNNAAERVTDVLRRANRALQRQQQFTIAMVRALSTGDQTIAPVVREVRELMASIIVDAIGVDGEVDDDTILRAHLIQEVWLSAQVGWIGGVEPMESVDEKLAAAARLLLGELP
ncbi:UNVERIFIED_CONTAM: hypothetical protein GTU68_026305 [Idotea baltica]|nr:hypothetical protein [Idotea baltica]